MGKEGKDCKRVESAWKSQLIRREENKRRCTVGEKNVEKMELEVGK